MEGRRAPAQKRRRRWIQARHCGWPAQPGGDGALIRYPNKVGPRHRPTELACGTGLTSWQVSSCKPIHRVTLLLRRLVRWSPPWKQTMATPFPRYFLAVSVIGQPSGGTVLQVFTCMHMPVGCFLNTVRPCMYRRVKIQMPRSPAGSGGAVRLESSSWFDHSQSNASVFDVRFENIIRVFLPPSLISMSIRRYEGCQLQARVEGSLEVPPAGK